MYFGNFIHTIFQTFQPETTDIYDKKNIPRLIYCIHALSSHLFKLGKAPLIHDVFGKVVFTGIIKVLCYDKKTTRIKDL